MQNEIYAERGRGTWQQQQNSQHIIIEIRRYYITPNPLRTSAPSPMYLWKELNVREPRARVCAGCLLPVPWGCGEHGAMLRVGGVNFNNCASALSFKLRRHVIPAPSIKQPQHFTHKKSMVEPPSSFLHTHSSFPPSTPLVGRHQRANNPASTIPAVQFIFFTVLNNK
jgi:hypothetical protein